MGFFITQYFVFSADVSEVTSFDKTKLKKTETKEKNPLPTKESKCHTARSNQCQLDNALTSQAGSFLGDMMS